jgi:hypothetical protein
LKIGDSAGNKYGVLCSAKHLFGFFVQPQVSVAMMGSGNERLIFKNYLSMR